MKKQSICKKWNKCENVLRIFFPINIENVRRCEMPFPFKCKEQILNKMGKLGKRGKNENHKRTEKD